MQVSRSKKWISKPALDKDGKPVLNSKGKPILKKSYSILQDDFFNAIRAAGYTDVERGERGSTEEHLTVTQFKVRAEQERLEVLEAQTEKKEQQLQRIEQKTKIKKSQTTAFAEIDRMGRRTFTGKIELTPQEANQLKKLAKRGISDLKKKLESARQDARILHMEKASRSRPKSSGIPHWSSKRLDPEDRQFAPDTQLSLRPLCRHQEVSHS